MVAATGRPLGAWQRAEPRAEARGIACVMLLPPRAQLYAACDARFSAMMEQGAVEETRALLARGLAADLPAMKAVGVRELASFIAGTATRDAAVAAAQQSTRRYAKRQYTWLRHRMAGLHPMVVEAQFSESLLPRILPFIRQRLLTAKI